VEILNQGRPAPPGGTGEVVITNLFSRYMPFIRYSLGDICEVDRSGICPESNEPLSIKKIRGRTLEDFVLADGRKVSPYIFMPDYVPGVLQFRVIQDSPEAIRILVVKGKGLDVEELEEARNFAQNHIGDQGRVSIEFVDAIPEDR